MSLLEKVWDYEDKTYRENMEKNRLYFENLSNEEKFNLLWEEYVSRHINDLKFI